MDVRRFIGGVSYSARLRRHCHGRRRCGRLVTEETREGWPQWTAELCREANAVSGNRGEEVAMSHGEKEIQPERRWRRRGDGDDTRG